MPPQLPIDRRMKIVRPLHDLRPEVEACVTQVYKRAFDARDLSFPPRLIALVDRSGLPICAAGLRTYREGFFSEVYLDGPIEDVLTAWIGHPVRRCEVFEITTLASRAGEVSPHFIRQIVMLGKRAGFRWCFFTATVRLRSLIQRLRIPVAELGPADPARIAEAWRWGRYYAEEPVVCAVSRASLEGCVMAADKASVYA